MIDSHAHLLEDAFDGDREELIARLPEQGVKRMIEAGVDVALSERAQQLAHTAPYIYFMAGIHPHETKDVPQDWEMRIAALAADEKCVAIGEIGLDYHYDFSPRTVQRELFARQLELAAKLQMPVCIHSREATEDTYAALKEFFPKVRGVLHSYSGSVEMAQKYLDLGYMISLGGVVTFKNANRLLEVAKMIPEDCLLVETDCPYLTPVPLRGRRNEPAYVRHTLECIARLRGVSPQELERQTEQNTYRAYSKLK